MTLFLWCADVLYRYYYIVLTNRILGTLVIVTTIVYNKINRLSDFPHSQRVTMVILPEFFFSFSHRITFCSTIVCCWLLTIARDVFLFSRSLLFFAYGSIQFWSYWKTRIMMINVFKFSNMKITGLYDCVCCHSTP